MNVYVDSSTLLRVVLKEPGAPSSWSRISTPVSSELIRVEMPPHRGPGAAPALLHDEERGAPAERAAGGHRVFVLVELWMAA